MSTISIVIPTLNDEATLHSCLESIVSQDYPGEEYEIIVVDGGSTDETVQIATEYGCRVFTEDKGTIGYAREVGVQKATGDFIAFTDADCVVNKQWLARLEETLTQDDKIAGVGGPNVTPADDSPLAQSVGDFFELFSKVGARYGYSSDSTTEVEHNPTCNVLYRKEVIEEVGGFNEQLVTVDDEEMDYRIKQRGYRLLFRPDAVVDHYRRPTWHRFMSMAYSYGYGRGQAVRLHRELGKWFHFAPTVTALLVTVLSIYTLLTPVSVVIPVVIVLFGELTILGVAQYMRQQNHRGVATYVGIINIWLGFWSVGFAKGLFNPPNSVTG